MSEGKKLQYGQEVETLFGWAGFEFETLPGILEVHGKRLNQHSNTQIATLMFFAPQRTISSYFFKGP